MGRWQVGRGQKQNLEVLSVLNNEPMNEDQSNSVHQEVLSEVEEEQREKVGRRISFWLALVVSTAVTLFYFQGNPQESEEVQRMRLYFKENKRTVMEFIRLPHDKLKPFAEKQTHPFFMSFIKASINEKGRIKAMIHNSVDYSPNQYWFNLFFLWMLSFLGIWFMALMAQAMLIQVRLNPKIT